MDKEHLAMSRLQEASEMSLHHYHKPLLLCDSGGKDSSVLKQVAINAGIPFEVQHNHTTADAPETFFFIQDEFKRLEALGIPCSRFYPVYKKQRVSMWTLIPQKLMPPTRIVRYCCSVLKERGGAGRFIATGVRWAESPSRKKNRGIFEKGSSDKKRRVILMSDNDDRHRLFEHCQLRSRRAVNPIIDWTDAEVWDYIADQHIPCNPAYCKYNLKRCGCVGCPMAGTQGRLREFSYWKGFKQLYIQAFDKMLIARQEAKLPTDQWETGMDVFHWWMEDGVLSGQIDLLEEQNLLAEQDEEDDDLDDTTLL